MSCSARRVLHECSAKRRGSPVSPDTSGTKLINVSYPEVLFHVAGTFEVHYSHESAGQTRLYDTSERGNDNPRGGYPS